MPDGPGGRRLEALELLCWQAINISLLTRNQSHSYEHQPVITNDAKHKMKKVLFFISVRSRREWFCSLCS